MKNTFLLICTLCLSCTIYAQNSNNGFVRSPALLLPDIKGRILAVQNEAALISQKDDSKVQEVNTIVSNIDKTATANTSRRSATEELLIKNINPVKHFFQSSTNKAGVPNRFITSASPYMFCKYHADVLVLYLYAIDGGNGSDLSKVTEKKAATIALEDYLIPALKATDEFKESDIPYLALSVYFDCKDNRDGAPKAQSRPYCLTILAKTEDLQQFKAGKITSKDMMLRSELYLSDGENLPELRRIYFN